MKYCSHCGNELLDEAILCPKCGCPVDGGALSSKKKEELSASNKDWFDLYSFALFGALIFFEFIAVLIGIYTNLRASYWLLTIFPLLCSIAYLIGAFMAKETKYRVAKLIGGAVASLLTFVAFILWVVVIA